MCQRQDRAIVRRGFDLLDQTNQPGIPINSKLRMKEFTTSSNYLFTQEILYKALQAPDHLPEQLLRAVFSKHQ